MKCKFIPIFSILFIFFISSELHAGKLEKGFERLKVYDYFNAKKYFEQSMKNDGAAAAFGLGIIYSSSDNPFYNPNEARKWILYSDSAFRKIKEKKKKFYGDFGVTDSSIKSLSLFICEDAFFRAKEKHTVEVYNNYLRNFSTCGKMEQAYLLRDSVAYEDARKLNTSSAFKEFMVRYPGSLQYKRALDSYNECIFYENTVEKDLSSYENFLINFPESPYRSAAEKKIFELVVPAKTLDQYILFVRKYNLKVDTKDAWKEVYRLFMKDFSMESYNNFKDSFPDYPFQAEFDTDFRLQNFTFLPVNEMGHWGYINEFGKQMIDPVYEEVSFFSEGLAGVSLNKKYGFINKAGKTIIPFIYDDVEPFHSKSAIVMMDELYGLIDNRGDFLIPPIYEELNETEGDLYIASQKGLYGYLVRTGQPVTSFSFDIAKDFKNGYAVVSKDEKYGLINREGKFVIPPQYTELDFLNDSLLRASDEDDQWGIINMRGESIVPFMYDAISDFNENRSLVAKDSKCGYIDGSGKIVIPIKYQYSSLLLTTAKFQNGYALLKQKTKSILIDTAGNQIKFTGIEDYGRPGSGLIPIQKKKKWGYADFNGKVRIPCLYEAAESFIDTLAIIRKNKIEGLIDTSGVIFIQPLYQEIILLKNAIQVKNNNLWGLLSRSGILYVPCQYSRIDFITPEIVQAMNENGYTYINVLTGKIIYTAHI